MQLGRWKQALHLWSMQPECKTCFSTGNIFTNFDCKVLSSFLDILKDFLILGPQMRSMHLRRNPLQIRRTSKTIGLMSVHYPSLIIYSPLLVYSALNIPWILALPGHNLCFVDSIVHIIKILYQKRMIAVCRFNFHILAFLISPIILFCHLNSIDIGLQFWYHRYKFIIGHP